MQPTRKAPAIEGLITGLMGKDRRTVILEGKCMTCDAGEDGELEFKDELSIREYRISGMCQECQDAVFS